MVLNEGALLQGGKYKVEKCIGHGGFGITYLAVQVGLDREVAIKEFFIRKHCSRDESTKQVYTSPAGEAIVAKYRQKFIKEAKTIAALNHPNVVKIYDVFEENNTAYYVMERLEPRELSVRIPATGLPEQEALGYLRQIGEALKYVHSKKILHLDVKPSNVMFRNTGEAVLIDFGVSKRYDSNGGQTSSTPIGVSVGYAPIEQFNQDLKSFTPATDVYSLAATLYKLVTGVTPPDTTSITDGGDDWLPDGMSSLVRDAIKAGMAIRRKDRPQTVQEFLDMLESHGRKGAGAYVGNNVQEETLTVDDLRQNKPFAAAEETSVVDAVRQKPQRRVPPANRPKKTGGGSKKTLIVKAICFIAFAAVGAVVAFMLMGGKEEQVAEAPKVIQVSGGTDTPSGMKPKELDYKYSDIYPMVFVEGGRFDMGTEEESFKNPLQENVYVSSFYIGKYEVSKEFWNRVMGKKTGKNDEPVIDVSYNDALKFIEKLNSICGTYSFSLPTEEQWEYAASGGVKDNGDNYATSDGNIDDVYYDKLEPCEVDSKKCINALGLYHMSGNVAEWCINKDPDSRDGALRGGSYFDCEKDYVNVSFRLPADKSYKDDEIGFRIVYNVN